MLMATEDRQYHREKFLLLYRYLITKCWKQLDLLVARRQACALLEVCPQDCLWPDHAFKLFKDVYELDFVNKAISLQPMIQTAPPSTRFMENKNLVHVRKPTSPSFPTYGKSQSGCPISKQQWGQQSLLLCELSFWERCGLFTELSQPWDRLEFLGNTATHLTFPTFPRLFGQQNSVDIGQYTTIGNSNSSQQLAQFFIIAHSKLNVARHYAILLVVSCSIPCQFQHLQSHFKHN